MAERAVNLLIAAGMVLRYRSAHGNSYYLGWRGRSGVLRVSDHPSSRNEDGAIVTRLTFAELKRDLSEQGFRRRVQVALGHYLMTAAPGKEAQNPYGANWQEFAPGREGIANEIVS